MFSKRTGGAPRGPSMPQRGRDDLQELQFVVRDQLNILNSIKDEEESLEGDIAEIESKINELEAIKKSNSKEIILDPNFMTRCYNSVVFADDAAKARLIQIGRTMMMQSLVKRPDPFVSIYMQYDFITAWQICLQQSVKVLKQMRLSVNISVLDSMTNVADMIQKYAGPVDSMRKTEIADKAMKFRNQQIYNHAGNGRVPDE